MEGIPSIADYEALVGSSTVERILKKARQLSDLHIVNFNSTYYGGDVAELLSSITLLMNTAGIRTGWRVIQGRPDFFSITKQMHNALQGEEINLTNQEIAIYEDVVYENALRKHIDHDIVIVHDPRPLPLIEHYRKKGPWIWRCHVDISHPHAPFWTYVTRFIERYDAVVFSLPEYAQKLTAPQRFIAPGINPFSSTNREMSETDISQTLAHYNIPADLPIAVQVSRFGKWKDPQGVVDAFRIARKQVDCTLGLVGNVATDDWKGKRFLLPCAPRRVSVQDSTLVNALQRRAAVVLQKSTKEGFGLTVAEAMWKGAAVIGERAGGIVHQIEDGVNGFLVHNVEDAAQRMVMLLMDRALAARIGQKAKESVRQRFLMTRHMEDWLDLMGSFEARFWLRGATVTSASAKFAKIDHRDAELSLRRSGLIGRALARPVRLPLARHGQLLALFAPAMNHSCPEFRPKWRLLARPAGRHALCRTCFLS